MMNPQMNEMQATANGCRTIRDESSYANEVGVNKTK